MKYIYISTLVLPVGVDPKLERFSNEDQMFWQLTDPNRYREVYIELKLEGETETLYIKPEQIIGIPGFINMTIKAIFESEFETELVPFTPIPTVNNNYTKYYDAEKMNYQLRFDCYGIFTSPDPTNRPPSIDIPSDTPISQMPDILMTNVRYPTNVAMLNKTSVVLVNGFAHQSIIPDDTELGLYVKDGGKTANTSKFMKVGILDFSSAGGVQIFPLSTLTVVPRTVDVYHGYIDVYNVPVDLTSSQIVLSIAGYLIFPEDAVLTKTGVNGFSFNLQNVSIEQKIVEASKYLNVSSLGLEELIELEDTSGILTQNSVLQALLNLSQSFLVVIPKSQMVIYNTYIHRNHDARAFYTNFLPTQYFSDQNDRCLNYWPETYVNNNYNSYRNIMTDFQSLISNIKSRNLYYSLIELFPEYKPLGEGAIIDVLKSIGYNNELIV